MSIIGWRMRLPQKRDWCGAGAPPLVLFKGILRDGPQPGAETLFLFPILTLARRLILARCYGACQLVNQPASVCGRGKAAVAIASKPN
jgi:hypothetical protein